MTKKIAIVGFASSSRDQAPQDGSFEVWGMNSLYLNVESRWDRWFEMHSVEDMPGVYPQIWNDHKEWLKKFPGPIYTHEKIDWLPNSVEFPVDDMRDKFGEYYTSTVAFMLALAIHEEAEEIHVYGIDMVGDDEYGFQKSNTEFLLGYAKGKGIKVYIPPQSALLSSPGIYGLPGEQTDFSAFQTDIKRRLLEMEAQQKALLEDNKHKLFGIHRMDGRLEAYGEALNWYNTENGQFGNLVNQNADEAREKRKELIAENEKIVYRINACDGAMQEGGYYLSRLRSHRRGGALLLGEKHQQEGGKT
jgi:hypothetical protein